MGLLPTRLPRLASYYVNDLKHKLLDLKRDKVERENIKKRQKEAGEKAKEGLKKEEENRREKKGENEKKVIW